MSGRIDRTPGSNGRASRSMRWMLWSTLAVVAACGSAATETQSQSGYSTGTGGTGSGTGGTTVSTGTAGLDGLPCEIAALLASKCVSCHSNPPIPNVPSSLSSYADLTAPSKGDPTKSAAVMALARMKSAVSPMPPAPGAPASAAEIAAFEAWVNAGTPMGTCGDVDAGPNPFDAPAQCTSMANTGNTENKYMFPGRACVSCHAKDPEAPPLVIGGTVYATPHEPNDCNAAPVTGPAIETATVEITDNNGTVITLKTSTNGNFYRKASSGAVALPYTAKVKYNGLERIMVGAQMSGDCNECHTQAGTQNAPGRILLP